MKILIVVDMQNDFISGSLGSDMAEAIVPKVVEKVKNFDGELFFTKDTHDNEYLKTQEGKKLPVPHCVIDTYGQEICPELLGWADNSYTLAKASFGTLRLPKMIENFIDTQEIESIELCGLCTDICVISNAMILKSAFTEIPITVDASCCAGVTEESHKNALNAMKSVQINVINEN